MKITNKINEINKLLCTVTAVTFINFLLYRCSISPKCKTKGAQMIKPEELKKTRL